MTQIQSIVTRVGLVPRRAGLSSADFQRRWHRVHGPLGCKLKGLRRYWQNHAVLRRGEPILPWPGFDACGELDFDDVPALRAAFSAEHFPAGLEKDTEELMDKSNGAPSVMQRVMLAGDIDLTRVRLMTFMRRAPGCTVAQLESAVRQAPQAMTARARELYLCPEDLGATTGILGFDAIDVQWFDSPQEAERYVISAAGREHRHAIGRIVQGVERLIARVRVVM